MEKMQFQAGNLENRKKTRLLSSLQDLKLESEAERKGVNDEEGKRKVQKYCPIKIATTSTQIHQNFQLLDKKKSIIDKNLILKSLGSHFVFSTLIKDKVMQDMLLEKFKLCRVNKGEYLMKQNDNASSFFILHEGELSVQIDEKIKRKIQSGEGFGELSLLYSSPRSASIKANKTSYLWFVDRTTFRKAISSFIEKSFSETRQFIEDSKFFQSLTPLQKDKISSNAISQKFSKGQIICKENELASSMYIIKSGELSKSTHFGQTKLKEGDYFGEYTMLQKNCKWKETVIAENDSELIALGAEDIQIVLGKSLPLIVIRNKAKDCLQQAKQFINLSSHYLDLALDCFKIRNVMNEEKISSLNGVFFILEGQYQILKLDENLLLIPHKQNSNCKTLFGSILDDHKESEVIFKTNGKIAWASPSEVILSFKGTYKEAIEKSAAMEKRTINHRNYISQIRSECQKYSLNDYKVLTKLGEGQFGTVFLVTDPSKTRFYALKCISKYQTVKNKLEKHLINEKKIMEDMNSITPFAVSYVRSYKDEHFVYLLMEYINGLQLFDVIRLIGILNPDQSRFYVGLIIEFLQKIHNKNIIYRDLKPENVMVTEDGYLKMIDMGTCKKMQIDKGNGVAQKTFTIIGTPNYMAPEIISGKGYSTAVDLWSLGIVLYEFMAGYVPFGQQAEDPYQIYQEIIKKDLQFPSYMKDPASKSFITQLLSKLPEMRLSGTYSSLKKHSFLQPVQWDLLIDKKVKATYEIPKNKLIEVSKFVGKTKNLSEFLHPPVNSKPINRKQYNINWDQLF